MRTLRSFKDLGLSMAHVSLSECNLCSWMNSLRLNFYLFPSLPFSVLYLFVLVSEQYCMLKQNHYTVKLQNYTQIDTLLNNTGNYMLNTYPVYFLYLLYLFMYDT